MPLNAESPLTFPSAGFIDLVAGGIHSISSQRQSTLRPFRDHNITSKPAMVRHFVLDGWKSPTFSMFFVTGK
jgi:hypothetical protein